MLSLILAVTSISGYFACGATVGNGCTLWLKVSEQATMSHMPHPPISYQTWTYDPVKKLAHPPSGGSFICVTATADPNDCEVWQAK